MRRTFILVLLAVALIFTMATVASAFKNEPPGFRGFMWGANIEECKGLVKVAEHGERKDYKLRNERLVMGEANLTSVEYSFYKDRFYRVIIDYSDTWNYEDILKALTESYGPPVEAKGHFRTWWWLGDSVSIGLQYGVFTRGGTLSFIYTPIQLEKENNEITSAAKAGKEF